MLLDGEPGRDLVLSPICLYMWRRLCRSNLATAGLDMIQMLEEEMLPYGPS